MSKPKTIYLVSKGKFDTPDLQLAFLTPSNAQMYIKEEFPEFSEVSTRDGLICHFNPRDDSEWVIIEPVEVYDATN